MNFESPNSSRIVIKDQGDTDDPK